MKAIDQEILLVEDDPADAELALLCLKKEQLVNRIDHARDGAEALDYVFCRGTFSTRSFDHPPCLILLDLQLPRVNGHDVLRTIKSDDRTRSIPIIVLTSSDHERDLQSCYQLGANSYIQKPVNLQRFQEIVHQIGMYWLMVNRMPPPTCFNLRSTGDSQ